MKFQNIAAICILSFINSVGSLHAIIPKDVQQRIDSDLANQKYNELGWFLKEKLDSQVVTLNELRKIAQKKQSTSLLQAVKAADNFMQEGQNGQNLDLSLSDFFRIALFIETSLPSYIARHEYYLQKSRTNLPRIIEHDPTNGAVFIINDSKQSAFLGRGARKIAYKAIVYNNACPKIVVQARQRGGKGEAAITKKLQGAPGILKMEGFSKREIKGKKCTTLYSKFYSAGDLQNAFDRNAQFILVEKMQIACNILQGLEALASHRLVHRDLGAKNIFFNWYELEKGQWRIEAAIGDLGCARTTKAMAHKRPQVSFKNMAPEGVFFEKLKGADFFLTDLYAAGLVLYRLFYGRYAVWQEKQFHGADHYKQYRLNSCINHATQSRRNYLWNQQMQGQSSVEEDFELIVLRMVSANPKKRRTATRLLQDLRRIYDSEHYSVIPKEKKEVFGNSRTKSN